MGKMKAKELIETNFFLQQLKLILVMYKNGNCNNSVPLNIINIP